MKIYSVVKRPHVTEKTSMGTASANTITLEIGRAHV